MLNVVADGQKNVLVNLSNKKPRKILEFELSFFSSLRCFLLFSERCGGKETEFSAAFFIILFFFFVVESKFTNQLAVFWGSITAHHH